MPSFPLIGKRSRALVARADVPIQPSQTHSRATLDTGSSFKSPRRASPLATVYYPIDSDRKEIRLIRLFPGQGDDVVRCTVHTTFLLPGKISDYETVSYRWTDMKDCVIQIDGKDELVKGSAVQVLKGLRYPTKCRVLWIDAICIDQWNDAEKGDQVSFMGDIYRHGHNNLIWLVPADESDPKEVVEALRAVLSNKSSVMKDDKRFRQLMIDPEGAETHDGRRLDPAIKMGPLQKLYECDWFCRLWVAQEATLAPKSVCHFGQYTFPLAEVLDAAVWLIYNKSMLSHALRNTTGIHAARAMWYLLDQKNDTDRDLLMAFILAQNFQATEPRDHVYALLGLYKDQSPHLCLRGLYLRPNYTKPLGNVFRDATRACIEDSGNLQTLQFVQPSQQSKDMAGAPSWTLRFDSGASGMDADPLCKLGNGFNADNNLPSHAHFRDHDTLLALGSHIDVVHEQSDPFSEAMTWAHGKHAKHMKMISSMIRKRRSGPEWATELGLILTAGSNIEPSPLIGDFRAFLSYSARRPSRPPVVTRSQAVDNDYLRASRWYARFEETVHGRRFFMTKLGLAGIGPLGMKCRDVIAVLRGASVPFVLRPTSNILEYVLVGPCYVFGLMHGEASDCKVDWLSIK